MLESICLVEFQKSAVEHVYAKVYSFFSSAAAVVMIAKGPFASFLEFGEIITFVLRRVSFPLFILNTNGTFQVLPDSMKHLSSCFLFVLLSKFPHKKVKT